MFYKTVLLCYRYLVYKIKFKTQIKKEPLSTFTMLEHMTKVITSCKTIDQYLSASQWVMRVQKRHKKLIRDYALYTYTRRILHETRDKIVAGMGSNESI